MRGRGLRERIDESINKNVISRGSPAGCLNIFIISLSLFFLFLFFEMPKSDIIY